MNYLIAPSILSADFAHLMNDIEKVEKSGAHLLHLDVMDGHFVPQISFGLPILKALEKRTDLSLDVHLMTEKPEYHIDAFADAGADSLIIHVEACIHLDATLQKIKDKGIACGVALNPTTPLSVLEYIWEYLDVVLLMTVNPGAGGQTYLPYCTQKIAQVRQMIQTKKLSIDVAVDGGINLNTLPLVMEAGANRFIMGSAIYQGEVEENMHRIKTCIDQYTKA
ncbi:ribulose-phosphate 3-epimerase [Clostridia bacterium]|nr:ribulose-phosphate 3-epimerase [Clostridia bacterium]